jgi:hypothetical protein
MDDNIKIGVKEICYMAPCSVKLSQDRIQRRASFSSSFHVPLLMEMLMKSGLMYLKNTKQK